MKHVRPETVAAAASRGLGLLVLACAALVTGGLAGCTDEPPAQALVGGDAERGRLLLRQYGCGSCHRIPGVAAATGTLAPPLARYARQVYVAGVLPNTPENLVRWIVDPQAIEPGTAMPDMQVSAAQARDMVAYLYTLE